MSESATPQQQRKRLRARRRNLATDVRLDNELRICGRILRLPGIRRCRRLGLYISEDGEVDLRPLQFALLRFPINFYLPVLRPGRQNQLWFAPYRPGDPLQPNRFGIGEPNTRKRPPVCLRSLDMVLMPLVGFDEDLNRLGMGGGFYDRSFAFLRNSRWRRPRLIGIAHECQKLTDLNSQPWDVSMDAVVTERALYRGKTEKLRQNSENGL